MFYNTVKHNYIFKNMESQLAQLRKILEYV